MSFVNLKSENAKKAFALGALVMLAVAVFMGDKFEDLVEKVRDMVGR